MRLREFNEQDMSLTQAVEVILRDCQPYLSHAHTLAYRGMSRRVTRENKMLQKMFTEANRPPRDTAAEIHTAVVDWFQQTFGVGFREEYALFLTGSENTADDYGVAYAVFPIGPITYSWSPKVKDLTESLAGFASSPHDSMDTLNQDIFDFMDDQQFVKNIGLDQAINSRKEVVFSCKEYYILDLEKMRMSSRVAPDEYDAVMKRLFS